MQNRIRILATSDVHGAIFPYRYADNKPANVGFARLNTLISKLRDDNTLVIDNGDTLEGSPLSFFHFYRHPDDVSPMTTVMHDMHYDYINVGNHDFNYGEEALMMHLQNVGAPCITSNFIYHGKPYGPTYVIQEIAGKKVALIGVVTQYIPHWETPAHIKKMRFNDAFETLKKNVELVKSLEKPDYIIGIYHGGFERDLKDGYLTEEDTGENEAYRMIQMIPELDVLITGHQHRSLSGILNHTAYTQTRDNGQQLACIDIYTDTGVIEPHVIDCDQPADDNLLKFVQPEEDECQTWLDSTLGTTNIDLKIANENEARLHKSQLITFLNKVEMEVTGADLASTALFLGATGFDHEITMRNLVSTYVYPNTLVVKKINGRILKEYLEKDAEFWMVQSDGKVGVNPEYDWPKPQHYNYDMLDGVEYTVKASNPIGQRIISLTRNGKPVQPEDEFTICLNNYRAAGGGNYDMLKDAPTVSVNLSSMVELLAQYILDHKTIDFKPVNNIQVIA